MKNKLFNVLILMTILLSVFASAQSLTPSIQVTLMNQDPDPVGPGDLVEVRFKINNAQINSLAEDFEVEILEDYPVSLYDDSAVRKLGDVSGLGDGSNVLVVKYKLRIDDDAIEGDTPIKLRYKYKGIAWITREFVLSIQTLDANIGIVSVESIPEKIKPGEEAQVKVVVKNMADSTMKDVSLKLDLTYDGVRSSASTTSVSDSLTVFDTLPFAPVGSASEQKIYSLKPGEEHEFVYNLLTYSDAESKVYKVPIELSYYDELETEYTKTDIVGLVVGTKPDMSIILDEADLYVGKKSGDIVVKFINKGFSDVKFLDVQLADNGEYEVISAHEVYVGNVDSDDYETAEFTLYLKNGASKEETKIHLPLHVEYRDANNNLYQEVIDLELSVLQPEKLGIQQKSPVGGIVVLVLIVGIFLYFRRKRKNKK